MASLLFGLYSSVAELCHVIAIKYFPSNADNNRLQSVSSPSLWRIALDERKRREAGPTNCPLAGTSEDIICNDNHSTGEVILARIGTFSQRFDSIVLFTLSPAPARAQQITLAMVVEWECSTHSMSNTTII